MLRHLINYFSNTFSPPLEKLIAEAAETEAHTVMNCDHVIRMHEFQKHMAKSTILALAAWTSKEQLQAKQKPFKRKDTL